jgi:hypothetical protein
MHEELVDLNNLRLGECVVRRSGRGEPDYLPALSATRIVSSDDAPFRRSSQLASRSSTDTESTTTFGKSRW